MTKFTITGEELGASEVGVVVLTKTEFQNRDELLLKHKQAKAKVEVVDVIQYPDAIDRGNFLESGVANWGLKKLRTLADSSAEITMFEPQEAYRVKGLKLGASIDRILNVKNGSIHMEDKLGTNFEFSGKGNFEIKTDFYHAGKPKPQYIIQVQAQMLCANIDWSIICCLDQRGKLNLYPFRRDDELCRLISDCVNEFWDLVENDKEYEPLLDNYKDSMVDLIEEMPEHTDVHESLTTMCADYLKLSAQERLFKKEKENLKELISNALDVIEVEHCKINGFEIKSKMVSKPKRQMVETGEFTDSLSFSIKETK